MKKREHFSLEEKRVLILIEAQDLENTKILLSNNEKFQNSFKCRVFLKHLRHMSEFSVGYTYLSLTLGVYNDNTSSVFEVCV